MIDIIIVQPTDIREQPVSLRELSYCHNESRPHVVDRATKITILDLELFYGYKKVLNHIDLEIGDRSVTALIGPSGGGKSTLLRTLNRLYELYPDQSAPGEIIIAGWNNLDPGTDLRRLRANVAMAFQASTVFPMSIFGDIAFGIPMDFKTNRAECRRRVEQALRGAALWDEVKDILHKPAVFLSGGQQQRLCIARVIAMEPEIILLDEPCSALDPISTARIEDLIHELARSYCVVIVTHNMQQAARVADVAAFMYLGELIEVGTTEQIFVSPRNERTSDYVTGHFG